MRLFRAFALLAWRGLLGLLKLALVPLALVALTVLAILIPLCDVVNKAWEDAGPKP
jgi:hypothetical protein